MFPPSDGSPRSASAIPAPAVGYDPLIPALLHAAEPAGVSSASHRLRALATLSGSLTDALDPKDAADLVEQKALLALGATSAVVVTLGTFPPVDVSSDGASRPLVATTLSVLHAIGMSRAQRAAVEQLPLDAPEPLAEVARLGQPLFLSSAPELLAYPAWGATVIAAGVRSAAIVPVWANGELRGVLGLTWDAARTFDEDERAFVLTLGVMCAQAIMRAHLRSAERRAQAAAEEANRSKATFIATISHELRTPMNAVLGYTALIADEILGPVNPLQKDRLQRVSESGKHLLGLIDDLLSYARVEAGEERVHAESVLLDDIVEESLVLVRPQAMKAGLRIRVAGVHEPVELYTDPRKLRQILVNLLANAIKFSDTGEVVVLIRIEGETTDRRLSFEITDTGRGIAVVDQEHIFDPFWQADPTEKRSGGSTGLGLSVARQLARLLGGDVVVAQSALGRGSTFVLSLPVCQPAAQADVSLHSPTVGRRPA